MRFTLTLSAWLENEDDSEDSDEGREVAWADLSVEEQERVASALRRAWDDLDNQVRRGAESEPPARGEVLRAILSYDVPRACEHAVRARCGFEGEVSPASVDREHEGYLEYYETCTVGERTMHLSFSVAPEEA